MLKLKRIPVKEHKENRVFIHKDNKFLKGRDVGSFPRVEVHGGLQPLTAWLSFSEDENLVGIEELGLNINAFEEINLPEGADVSITSAPTPSSIESVRRKIQGGILSSSEYRSIIGDIAAKKYSKSEIAALIVANACFMSPQEVLSLTKSLVDHRYSIKWDRDMVVDIQSVGGVCGNRTNLIVAAIVIAYGICMPKMNMRASSRSSSDIDVMETMAGVDFSEKQITKIVEDIGGGVFMSGGKLLEAAADSILRDVESILGISTLEQIISSILSSAVAGGVTHLVVDVPVGVTTKIRSMGEAMRLRKLFEYVADMLAIDIDVVITDGSEPVGAGVGPVLEARDVMQVLRLKPEAPQDLREKSLFLAGRILEMDPRLKGGQGYEKAQELLDSGRALEVMSRIIHAQGKVTPPPLGQYTREILAPVAGIVSSINNIQINKIASQAGAPRDKGSGVDILKKAGDSVESGEALYRIHASDQAGFAFACGLAEGNSGFDITEKGMIAQF